MGELDDIQLLRSFVETGSEAAFAALVRRQIDLVYSIALRQTRRPEVAEEVTQAVFVVLVRKAHTLLELARLEGWLYQAARLTGANYLRSESRRARREKEAFMRSRLNESDPDPEEAWRQCAPLLESAMEKLSTRQRDAILLRYFQNKSMREVGLALGLNEDAARMRVNRAVERLRRFFHKRGVGLSPGAFIGALSAKSVQPAPCELAGRVAAQAAPGAALGGSVAALVTGTIKLLAWTGYRMRLGLSASTIVAAGVLTAVFLSGTKARLQAAGPIVATASGPISQTGPFPGTVSEGFDHPGRTGAQQQISILGGTATVTNLTRGGALKIERSSALDGVLVTPRSAPLMLGQLGSSQWVFDPPLIKFGGYFANNSRSNDATVVFYDANNTLIGSVTARVPKGGGAWTWNGWQSDVPIERLVVTGNDVGFLGGFIWVDDVQVVRAPPRVNVSQDTRADGPGPNATLFEREQAR